MSHRKAALYAICFCIFATLTLTVVGRPTTADDAETTDEQTESDRWMAVKLASAQQILEHLTSGNFEDLKTSAQRIHVFNFLEKWYRDEDFTRKSDYIGQLNAFEFATKELIRNAEAENTEGSLKAYVAMTESCVRCHTLIRDTETE